MFDCCSKESKIRPTLEVIPAFQQVEVIQGQTVAAPTVQVSVNVSTTARASINVSEDAANNTITINVSSSNQSQQEQTNGHEAQKSEDKYYLEEIASATRSPTDEALIEAQQKEQNERLLDAFEDVKHIIDNNKNIAERVVKIEKVAKQLDKTLEAEGGLIIAALNHGENTIALEAYFGGASTELCFEGKTFAQIAGQSNEYLLKVYRQHQAIKRMIDNKDTDMDAINHRELMRQHNEAKAKGRLARTYGAYDLNKPNLHPSGLSL